MGFETKERHETDEETAFLLFRSSKGREYLDINLDIDCPACPDDGSGFGVLEMDWKGTEGPYDTRGHDWVATCPKCGYTRRYIYHLERQLREKDEIIQHLERRITATTDPRWGERGW